MKNNFIKKITLSALFLAIGFILPMLFGQIPVIGQMLLPMHIPVFLCGLICGWRYGLFIGFILPLARSLIFSVPVMYPTAMAVAVEMAVYGVIVGALYGVAKKKTVKTVYISMLTAMAVGRAARLAAEVALLSFGGKAFAWQAFATTVLLNAIPGIALQLILIPAIMMILDKTGAVKFYKKPQNPSKQENFTV